MNPVLRFLFDECLSRSAMDALEQVGSGHLYSHITGEKDRDWIPRIAQDGRWVVITADCGRQSAHPDRLPQICTNHKVTHLLLTQSVHRLSMESKRQLLLNMWEQIVETLGDAPPGTRFRIRLASVAGTRDQTRPTLNESASRRSRRRSENSNIGAAARAVSLKIFGSTS